MCSGAFAERTNDLHIFCCGYKLCLSIKYIFDVLFSNKLCCFDRIKRVVSVLYRVYSLTYSLVDVSICYFGMFIVYNFGLPILLFKTLSALFSPTFQHVDTMIYSSTRVIMFSSFGARQLLLLSF